MTYGKKIALTAAKYIGFREEPNNSGFKNKEFEKRMKDVGWSKSLAWCAFFCELVWKESYSDKKEVVDRLDKLFSGSATTTYKNFDLNKLFKCSPLPVVGALAVYRYGSGWQGHIGIVESFNDINVVNIEGNTNSQGGREGIEVARKSRPIKTKYSEKGLNIIGYVHPMELSEIP